MWECRRHFSGAFHTHLSPAFPRAPSSPDTSRTNRQDARAARFTYEFLAKPAGTHWYHAHTGIQYGEGLFAPLIIERRDERGDYDRDEVLVVNDWFRMPAEEILRGLTGGGAGGHAGMSGMQMGGCRA